MGNCLVKCCQPCCTKLGQYPLDEKSEIFQLQDVANDIQPLDVIWFRGVLPESHFFEGLGSCCFSDGQWSHCGLVVNTDILDIKNGVPGRLYLWESTTGDKITGPDVETQKITAGVQIRELEPLIRNYQTMTGTRIGWSQLKNNPWLQKQNQPDIKKALARFQAKFARAGYDSSIISIGYSTHLWDSCACCFCSKICYCCCCRSQQDRDKQFFCSEFIARIYQYLDILPEEIVAESVSPPALNGHDLKFTTPLEPYSYIL
jgi:hypothetical protein